MVVVDQPNFRLLAACLHAFAVNKRQAVNDKLRLVSCCRSHGFNLSFKGSDGSTCRAKSSRRSEHAWSPPRQQLGSSSTERK